MTVIDIQNVTKSYGGRRGVAEISMKVRAGQIYGFLGPNGAGKSTTIRLLLGFLRADSGEARILEQDCWRESREIKRQVGYVPGDVRLYPWLTASKAFEIVGSVRQLDLRTKGLELAEQFRLEPNLAVRKMSRGNRQKLSLVMALAHEPQLLILDEPTSGLDPLVQDVLMDCLKTAAKTGQTVLFSSHTLSEVESICDSVAVIKDGQIVVDETLDSLQGKAPRTIHLQLKEGCDLDAIPHELQVIRQTRDDAVLQMTGFSKKLIDWAASLPLRDLSISPPRLEDLFRQHYRTDVRQQDVALQQSGKTANPEPTGAEPTGRLDG